MNRYIAYLQKRASLHGAAISAGKDLASTLKTKVKKNPKISSSAGAGASGFTAGKISQG